MTNAADSSEALAAQYDTGYQIGHSEGRVAGYSRGYAEASDRVRTDILRVVEAHLRNLSVDPSTRCSRLEDWVRRERNYNLSILKDVGLA